MYIIFYSSKMLTAWSIFLLLLSTGAVGLFLDVESIVLEADNGRYLSPVHRDGLDILAAANSTPSEFSVIHNFDGTISFKANNGKYVSSIEHPGDIHLLQPIKNDIDRYCKFLIINDGSGAISIITGGGAFWTRADSDNIHALKTMSDTQSKFVITQVKIAGAKFGKQS